MRNKKKEREKDNDQDNLQHDRKWGGGEETVTITISREEFLSKAIPAALESGGVKAASSVNSGIVGAITMMTIMDAIKHIEQALFEKSIDMGKENSV